MHQATFNPYKLFTGAMIPNWLLERPEISPGAKLCYARLCQYSGKNGLCFPKQETIAQEIGCSTRQIQRYIRELTIQKLIKSEKKTFNSPKTYSFIWHEWIKEWVTNPNGTHTSPSVSEQDTSVVSNTTHLTPTPSILRESSKRTIAKVASATFSHYIEIFKRNPSQYQYTIKRRTKIEQRIREIQTVVNDLDKTQELIFRAVENRKRSKFHMGDNPQGKCYIDFVDHIFRSQEYTETLMFEVTNKQPIKDPNWFTKLKEDSIAQASKA